MRKLVTDQFYFVQKIPLGYCLNPHRKGAGSSQPPLHCVAAAASQNLRDQAADGHVGRSDWALLWVLQGLQLNEVPGEPGNKLYNKLYNEKSDNNNLQQCIFD